MSKELVRTVCRALLRSSRQFDTFPVLRVLISAAHHEGLSPNNRAAVDKFLQGRFFYWPADAQPASVCTVVRDAIRRETLPHEVDTRLEDGFQGLRLLNALLHIADDTNLLEAAAAAQDRQHTHAHGQTSSKSPLQGLQQQSSLATGQLLLAHPLEASWFKQAALLLCHHSSKGSYALSLNVPLPDAHPEPKAARQQPDAARGSPSASTADASPQQLGSSHSQRHSQEHVYHQVQEPRLRTLLWGSASANDAQHRLQARATSLCPERHQLLHQQQCQPIHTRAAFRPDPSTSTAGTALPAKPQEPTPADEQQKLAPQSSQPWLSRTCRQCNHRLRNASHPATDMKLRPDSTPYAAGNASINSRPMVPVTHEQSEPQASAAKQEAATEEQISSEADSESEQGVRPEQRTEAAQPMSMQQHRWLGALLQHIALSNGGFAEDPSSDNDSGYDSDDIDISASELAAYLGGSNPLAGNASEAEQLKAFADAAEFIVQQQEGGESSAQEFIHRRLQRARGRMRIRDPQDSSHWWRAAPYVRPVSVGGPIERTLQLLHCCPSLGGRLVMPASGQHKAVYLGGNMAKLAPLVQQGRLTAADMRWFVGESVWSKGQLEYEHARGTWAVVHVPPDQLHPLRSHGQEDLWHRGFQSMGGEFAAWSKLPDGLYDCISALDI